jgi:uncharacterized membrane protein YccC
MSHSQLDMNRVTIFKEAVKAGLAFAAVFGIAMRFGWMNPYWAGWAVAVIALPTAGEAIRKGTLRVLGTIPGCLAALVIQALAPQERWLFMFLTCAWAFFTSYMMVSRQKDSYLWTMACYVCLIILLSDVDSSENMFESAVFRTVETVMGVVVYTLISVFLWPRTNVGAIRQSSAALASALWDLCRTGRDALVGERNPEASYAELQGKVVQRLAQYAKVLTAESSESYEVSGARELWDRFHALSTAWLETAGRWQSGFAELARIDVRAVFPGLPGFFASLDAHFAALPGLLAGASTEGPALSARLEVDTTALRQLSAFDRAAVEVARREMERIDQLTAAMVDCARELAGGAISSDAAGILSSAGHANRSTWLPVPDWEHVRCAAFVAATTGVGFLIWILFDPPGHSGWFQVSGTIALLVAGTPQARASKFIAPVAVTSAICLAIYVLVMPQLSSFLGLGTLLFLCMFLVQYFFTGMARLFCNMAILNMLQIQNEQVYSFYVMVNVLLFLVMDFTFLFVMSYLLGSPRPEKTMLGMLNRFFRSAEFLMSRTGANASRVSPLDRWRMAFHQRRLQSMPAKLAAWGTAIDRRQCPDTTPELLQTLVVSLQTLVYRFNQLMDAGGPGRDAALARDVREDLATWHAGLEAVFGRWARHPEAEPVASLDQKLERQLVQLETCLAEVVDQRGGDLSAETGERFFRLLGGYRGVSEAALAYAGVAQSINWSQWREERFS